MIVARGMCDGVAAFGAERKHVTLPTDFRCSLESGHSPYGNRMARFAPFPVIDGANRWGCPTAVVKHSVGPLR